MIEIKRFIFSMKKEDKIVSIWRTTRRDGGCTEPVCLRIRVKQFLRDWKATQYVNRHSMNPATSLKRAREAAETIAASGDYASFVEIVRKMDPWIFKRPSSVVDRDYLRVVDHHLKNLLPHIQLYIEPSTRRVLDFGCGSGEALRASHWRWFTRKYLASALTLTNARSRLQGIVQNSMASRIAATFIVSVKGSPRLLPTILSSSASAPPC